jgi:hypothetical protein
MSEPCQVEFCLARGSRQAGTILLARRRAGGIVGTKMEGRLGLVVHAARMRLREAVINSDGIPEKRMGFLNSRAVRM